MSHRKRIRLAPAVLLALLLVAALAPAAAAQAPPPAIAPGGGGGGNTGSTNPPPGDTTNPPPTNGENGNGGNGGNGSTNPPPTNGNGGNGDNGMMMAPMNWPPPNAIVHHAATPIQISSLEGGLQVYLIGPDGTAVNGPLLASLSGLAEMHPEGGAVQLYEGVNPGSGKPVTIEYLPAEMKLRVRTFYADKPPHDFDKSYIFTVDADHSVNHERW